MNIIIVTVIVALLILSLYLIVFNLGSPKLYTTIFVGLATFIASTFFVLKPEIFLKSFGVSIAIVEGKEAPALVVKGGDMNKVENRQSRLAGFFAHYKQKNKNEKTMDQELILEALEYGLIEDFLMFGRPLEGVASVDRGDGIFEITAHVAERPSYPTFKIFDVNDFSSELGKNRFFELDLMSWDVQKVKLPKGTRIALVREKDTNGFRIWKKNFFDIRIKIQRPSIKTASIGTVPAGFRSNTEASKSIRTENFNISLRADFYRSTSENPETEFNKDWVRSFFSLIESSYSDLHNREAVNIFM